MPAAARVSDMTSHGSPLNPGPGSLNVHIGFLPAWRAVPATAVAAIQAALTAVEATITGFESASQAAAGTPGAPAALAAEASAKAAAISSMSSTMSATGADVHMCPIPSAPSPAPHGPGVVLQASTTVLINNMPATRQGDEVYETLGGRDPIAMGCLNVMIG